MRLDGCSNSRWFVVPPKICLVQSTGLFRKSNENQSLRQNPEPTHRQGPVKFDLCKVFLVKFSWKNKTQETKHWSDCTSGASKSCQ